jgi:hypothetical protein
MADAIGQLLIYICLPHSEKSSSGYTHVAVGMVQTACLRLTNNQTVVFFRAKREIFKALCDGSKGYGGRLISELTFFGRANHDQYW